MKRQLKKIAALGIAAVLSLAGSMTALAGEWKQDEVGWWYQEDDGSYPRDTWKYISGTHKFMFDANGYMVASGNWEGGCIMESGEIYTDLIKISQDGTDFDYVRNPQLCPIAPPVAADASGSYKGTLEWKKNIILNMYNSLGMDYGTYTFDYQLPENWKEQFPDALIYSTISNICYYKWGVEHLFEYRWQQSVDENNVLHIRIIYNKDSILY